MKFTLEIDLGNAEMQTANDVAAALVQVAVHITTTIPYDAPFDDDATGLIRDANGNKVGNWDVRE